LILAAFRIRSFRFQWPADLLTSWAFEMETLILAWYVMTQTGSVMLLTLFGSLQFLGTLAAPMFGVLGDRLGARFMLCTMRAIYVALAGLVMLLALNGWLTPAWVIVVAALNGVVRPNDQVMRNTLVGDTIPSPHLMSAIGLSRATMDSARVGGALAGAGLSSLLGIGPSYAAVTACYLASLALTFGVGRTRPVPDPSSPGPAPAPRSSRWGDLKDGLAHVGRTPKLLAVMWLAFLINMTAYPVSGGLLPYVAQRVYHVDATGLGWLVASFAIGGLLASILMATTGGSRHPERTTLVHTAIWYGLLLGFGHLTSMAAGIVVLLAAGFAQNVAMISMTAVLLDAAGDRFRARVMGVRTLTVYGLPLGLLAAGGLIERIGYPLTITAAATVGLLFTLLIGMKWRASMWRRQPATGRPASLPPDRGQVLHSDNVGM
jgi:predicted MFS family arabinose efflux permease